MYCGKCNAYIPDSPGIISCLECGTPLAETRALRDEIKRREELEAQKGLAEKRRADHRYGYLSALVQSFFSRYFYRDVFRRWTGSGILFLLFSTGICMLPYAASSQYRFMESTEKEWKPMVDEFPRVTVSEGRLSFDAKSPYVIREPKNQQIFMMFSRADEAEDSAHSVPAVFLVTPRAVAMHDAQGAMRVVPIPPKLSFVLTKTILLYWSRQAARWVDYISYPAFWVGAWMALMFVVLLYALGSKLIAWIMRVPADFQTHFRLTAIAITPMLLLDSLTSMVYPKGMPDWLSFCMPLFFIALGLWYNREPKPKTKKLKRA